MGSLIVALRIVAVLFYGVGAVASFSFGMNFSHPLKSLILIVAILSLHMLLALIPVRKIHTSKMITCVLIGMTSIFPAYIVLTILYDVIIRQHFFVFTRPFFFVPLITILVSSSSLPVLLFLEYKRHKHT